MFESHDGCAQNQRVNCWILQRGICANIPCTCVECLAKSLFDICFLRGTIVQMASAQFEKHENFKISKSCVMKLVTKVHKICSRGRVLEVVL